MLTRHKGKR